MASLQPENHPIKPLWNILGCEIRQRKPPIQIVAELEAALHHE